jgi:hypothetical protein
MVKKLSIQSNGENSTPAFGFPGALSKCRNETKKAEVDASAFVL